MNSEELIAYSLQHSTPEPALLQDLNRDTYLKMLHPRMLSGHLQGRILSMISKMVKPANILEIGTFTGYSAICLAEGLAPDGKLHTIEVNQELESYIRSWIGKAGLEDVITLHIADAKEKIPGLAAEIKFDLVFLDADKELYPEYYKLLRPYLSSGAYLIADNVLWDGKVISPHPTSDYETEGIKEFNRLVDEDPLAENIIIPVRDGLSVIRVL